MDERDTRVREPASGEATFYWRLPHVLVAVLGAAAMGAAVGLLVRGEAVLGSILLAVAVLALLVVAQEASRRRTSRLDEAIATGRDRARALSGYAATSLRTWSRASGRLARLRLEMRRLTRDRRQAQLELGAAAYAQDHAACRELIARMQALDEQLARRAAETGRAIDEAQSKLAHERLAIAPTEVHRAVQ